MGGLIEVLVKQLILPFMDVRVIGQLRLYLHESPQQVDLCLIRMFRGEPGG